MNFLEEALAPEKPMKCHMCRTLAQLDDELRAEVQEALDNPNVQHAAISRVLKRRGIATVGAGSISTHRREHGK